jgi:hypothetical protein
MTLAEFEHEIFAVALDSAICDIPVIRRLTATTINLRVAITTGGFIDVFYNEQTGTTAFALIHRNQRVFGADNTGGWHLHLFNAPESHDPLSEAMSFAEFVAAIEQHIPDFGTSSS